MRPLRLGDHYGVLCSNGQGLVVRARDCQGVEKHALDLK